MRFADLGRIAAVKALAGELAGYCPHAIAAAGELSSKAAAPRLTTVVLDGLYPTGGYMPSRLARVA